MRTESVCVPVCYDGSNPISQAIIENKFDILCHNVPVEDIFLHQTGSIVHRVQEVSFGRLISNYELFSELVSNSLRFVDPLTALRHAILFPDHSRQNFFTTMFLNKHGKLCCFEFNWQGDLRKFSSFVCGGLNDFWFKDYKFLVDTFVAEI